MNKRWIGGIVILFLVVAGLGCDQQAKLEEENKAVVMAATEALNNYDYDKVAQVYAADFHRHCQATPEVTVENLDQWLALLKEWEKSFPDAHVRIDMIVAEGDLVGGWGAYMATHAGPMGKIPATGRKVNFDFGAVHRLENGKIAETWVIWDNLVMLGQLGLYPPPTADTIYQRKAR